MEEENKTEVTAEVKEEPAAGEVRDPQGLLKSYNQLKEDIKSVREQLASLQSEKDSLASAKDKLEDAVKNDVWKQRALASEIKGSLEKQGLRDAERLMKYVGTEGLDFNEEGKLVGLDDRLKTLKSDLPEIFDPRRRAGGRADIFAKSVAEPQSDPLRESVRAAISPQG